MAKLQTVEVLGGPLDGRRIVWDPEIECMAWTDGSRIYQHAVDELIEGKRRRVVLRHVATVPLPKRKG